MFKLFRRKSQQKTIIKSEVSRVNLPIKNYDPIQIEVYFKVKDLAAVLDIPVRKVYYLIESKALKAMKVNRIYLITLDDVLIFFDNTGRFRDKYLLPLCKKYKEIVENNFIPNDFTFEIKLTKERKPFILYNTKLIADKRKVIFDYNKRRVIFDHNKRL